MSHHIYNTKSFIIDSYPSGESDKIINIYTEDFGLIRAVAKGIREMKSKLRYSLQDASYGTVALVRGREMWRVTNASKEISLFNKGLNMAGRRALVSLLRFVARFAPGEGKNSDIFENLKSASALIFKHQLKDQPKITTQDLEVLELASRVRIMYALGYIKSQNDDIESISAPLNLENLQKWQQLVSKFKEVLNHSIEQSHL